jgi:poly(hydroxyalkanoate) granule-associated protein
MKVRTGFAKTCASKPGITHTASHTRKDSIMVKKIKVLADNQVARNVKESTQQIWLAGLGAYARAQEEGNKLFEALVKEGESIRSKTRKVADAKVAAVAATASGTWDRLEQMFEERLTRAVATLGVPTKRDIDTLAKRVAELTAVVQKLSDSQDGARSATKAVAKPVAAEPAASEPVAAKPARATAAKKPAASKTAST